MRLISKIFNRGLSPIYSLHAKPPLMHLILTGRDAHPEVIGLADTVSEIQEIKYAYRKDIEPQPAIDY